MCDNHELQTTKEMLKDNIAAGKAVTASTNLWYSDVAVSELRISGEGTQLTVSGSLTKESGAAGNISALLIVAQYDADKKLVGTRCFPVTSESIEETVAILSDTVSAQAFVFDDLQTVIPLGAKANWPSGY